MWIPILVLAVAFCNIVLGLLVLLKNRGNFTHVSFFIAACILAIWLVVNYFGNDVTLSYETLLWLKRAKLFLPAMGLYFFLLFCLEYTRFGYKHFRPFAIIFGLATLAVSLCAASPLVIEKLVIESGHVTTELGVFLPVFVIFILSIFVAIIAVLFNAARHATGSAKIRLQIMTGSIFIALIITFTTNLILPVFFGEYDYTPLGLISNMILFGSFAYAVVKQRLFDIRAVVARSITYFILLVTLGTAYAYITFNISHIIFQETNVSVPQQTFNIAVALVLAFTFQPLKRFFEKLTDRIFYRDHYDSETLLNEVSHILATEIGLIELSRKVRNLLLREMRVSNVDIIVLNNDKVFAESGHFVVSRLEELAEDLRKLRGKLIVADEQPEGQIKDTLLEYGISVLATLKTKKEKRTGYILFGPKLSGDIYTNSDLKVISTIADQLAIATQNAKAYVEIQRFNQTLRSKITIATHKLREANQNLKQIDIIKDDFLSMASHQLRTPLTVVEGYISNILDGMYGDLNEKQKAAIKLTQSRVRLTGALVLDLLNVSRMEAGRFYLDLQESDINKAVEYEIEQLQLIAKEHNTKLEFKPPAQPIPTFIFDDQKIRQVIMNLIENAIRYSPDGKVTISLESSDKQLEFTVKDNGIGVPKAQQRNLFNKFYRADNAKRIRPDGTGIGLFLVKQVIEAHKGHIIFMSDGTNGSTFGFSIPLNLTSNENQSTKPVPVETTNSAF